MSSGTPGSRFSTRVMSRARARRSPPSIRSTSRREAVRTAVARRCGLSRDHAVPPEARDRRRRRTPGPRRTSSVCSPSSGGGRRRRGPASRDICTGKATCGTGPSFGCSHLREKPALPELRVPDDLVEGEDRPRAHVGLVQELDPLGAGPRPEQARAASSSTSSRAAPSACWSGSQVLPPDRAGRSSPRTGARAHPASRGRRPPSRRRRSRASRRSAAPAPRSGTRPVAKNAARCGIIQDTTPSVIDTSTSCPSPDSRRWWSAAAIANAAISAPPPRSATWTPGVSGGPSRGPVTDRAPA